MSRRRCCGNCRHARKATTKMIWCPNNKWKINGNMISAVMMITDICKLFKRRRRSL